MEYLISMEKETYPDELKYGPEHIWLRLEEDKRGRIGITYYAQKQLKEVVFVELPEVGSSVVHMEPFGAIESAKATSDLYSPASGAVVEVNNSLEDELVKNGFELDSLKAVTAIIKDSYHSAQSFFI